MSFEIQVNGRPFDLWETAKLSRSIDTNCGAFSFTNSRTIPGQPYPVDEGDFISILVNGIKKLTGFVDEVSVISDDKQHTISVKGRDTMADLIDSSVPDEAKVVEGPVALKKMCETVITSLNVAMFVNDEVSPAEFTDEDLQAASSGENAMAFLTGFSRKRQVYLVADGLGDMVIFRPSDDIVGTPLTRVSGGKTNNIKTSSSTKSSQGRYRTVVCKSADNFGASSDADYSGDGANRIGQATDPDIRGSRYLEIQAEESMTDDESTERAKEEVNLRRARGVSYVATVAGFAQNNGNLWDFGQIVPVNDEYADVKGLMFIRSVDMAVDITGGSRTKITCASVDAYTVTDIIPRSDARRSSIFDNA